MAPTHKNPSSKERTAVAPYNFVPIPDFVVPAETPPDHDKYTGLCGHFLVRLTTQSPTYIRGLLTTEEYCYQELEKDIEGNKTTEIVDGKKVRLDTPFRKLVKNKPDFFNYFDKHQPIIPGSSLRGMLRTLFEIVTYSKIQPVSDAFKIYFRAVAADNEDPLRNHYKKTIGNNASKVHVGYLEQDSELWYVTPAKTPKQINEHLRPDQYIKIRKDAIQNGSVTILISDYLGLDSQDYTPQYHDVTFEIGRIKYTNKKGELKQPMSASKIGDTSHSLEHRGTLVATGNMLETSDGTQPSSRMNVYLIPEVSNTKRIKLNDQAIKDYLKALTPFQKDIPFSSSDGILQKGRPIFYIPPKDEGSEIIYFGHTPNFRIPHLIDKNGEKRVVTPRDFVLEQLRTEDTIDFTEAVFGFIRSSDYRKKKQLKQNDKLAGYGSRIFVTDARLIGRQSNIFFVQEKDNTLVPKILASPKPTAFQLYLTQPNSEKQNLKHYGSQPESETTIRGYKLYWHKGRVTQKDLEPKAGDPNTTENGLIKEGSTQHTQIKPLRSDLTFEFKVYFENLTEIELGALSWIISLPENHCHKIGMGKPLGMGAILLHDIQLHIEDINYRYNTLFSNSTWAQPALASSKTVDQYKSDFETYMVSQFTNEDGEFKSLPRIQMLLTMLNWWERSDKWLSSTRYMEIKHDSNQNDEYGDRTILPDPEGVIKNGSPKSDALSKPSPQRFLRKEGKHLTGIVEYFGGKSGGIVSDTGEGIVKAHLKNLPAGMRRLHKGQHVRFFAVQEGDGLHAYEIELIGD